MFIHLAIIAGISWGLLVLEGDRCNYKVSAQVVEVHATPNYGMCSVLVKYSDHKGVEHDARTEVPCAKDTDSSSASVIAGCFGAMRPGKLYTDRDHLKNVKSFKSDIGMSVFAGSAIWLMIWMFFILILDVCRPSPSLPSSDIEEQRCEKSKEEVAQQQHTTTPTTSLARRDSASEIVSPP